MATSKIKSTYSLDVETVRQLEDMARRWNVSKSEVLRRAIRSAAELESPDQDALDALDRLQRSMNLTEKRSAAWAKRVREERTATRSRRGTPQG
jgi:predicted transcriptional regulator